VTAATFDCQDLGDQRMIEYKGYTGAIEFDPELRLFTGHVIDLRDEIYFEGDSVESLESSMRRAVDHYLSVCEQRGEDPERPFSGKLNLRLGSDLHRAATLAAAQEGESLNNWLVRVVESAAQGKVAERPTRTYKRTRPSNHPTKKTRE
jgi:predicted HicB family RNase H-like nuclease